LSHEDTRPELRNDSLIVQNALTATHSAPEDFTKEVGQLTNKVSDLLPELEALKQSAKDISDAQSFRRHQELVNAFKSKPDINVHVDAPVMPPIQLHVIEQAAPQVNFTPPEIHVEAPVVNVSPPDVHVKSPDIKVDVHVPEQPKPAKQSRRTTVRKEGDKVVIERDDE